MREFQKGDHVRVVRIGRFRLDEEAIVVGSYKDLYGHGDADTYTIHMKYSGESAWYYPTEMILIEKGRLDLLALWEHERAEEIKQKSDLDWIFDNGQSVVENPHGASVQALANCFGLTNLWGNHGEGMTYYYNTLATMEVAAPFLTTGDKEGWIDFCDKVKAKKETG